METKLPDAEAAAVEAVAKLVGDPGRPLHLRVLGARTLSRWGAVNDALEKLASDPRTSTALRSALTSE